MSLSGVLEVIDGRSGDILYQAETALESGTKSLIDRLKNIGLENDVIPDTIRTYESEILGVVLGYVPHGVDTPLALVYLHAETGEHITLQLSQIEELVDGRTGQAIYLGSQKGLLKREGTTQVV